jgi:hypothetical protein
MREIEQRKKVYQQIDLPLTSPRLQGIIAPAIEVYPVYAGVLGTEEV